MQRRYDRTRPHPQYTIRLRPALAVQRRNAPTWSGLSRAVSSSRYARRSPARPGSLLARTLPIWGEGTLLGPTIAGLVHLFRPQPLVQPAPKQYPHQPALPTDLAVSKPLSDLAQRLTLPSPAVMPGDPPPDAPAS